MKQASLLGGMILCLLNLSAQTDSLAQPAKIGKISHAEPLYIDLIRDLGARKGEREFNVGMGMNDSRKMVNYAGFVEYEFAPVNRLGFEIEMPIQFYRSTDGADKGLLPENRIEGLKLATQYTLLVSEKYRTSVAVGYIQEFAFNSFQGMRHGRHWVTGTEYNPVFIAAKRWKSNLHTLIYTGPVLEHTFGEKTATVEYQLNLNVHYVFPGSGNFIGLETNIECSEKGNSVVFRPQLKLKLAPGIALGWVTGIPVNLGREGLSTMARLIWEPQRK